MDLRYLHHIHVAQWQYRTCDKNLNESFSHWGFFFDFIEIGAHIWTILYNKQSKAGSHLNISIGLLLILSDDFAANHLTEKYTKKTHKIEGNQKLLCTNRD